MAPVVIAKPVAIKPANVLLKPVVLVRQSKIVPNKSFNVIRIKKTYVSIFLFGQIKAK